MPDRVPSSAHSPNRHFSPAVTTADLQAALPLVRQLARRHLGSRCDACITVDDLTSAGNEGLARAARTYDPIHRTAFTSWAYRHIQGAIQDHLRHETRSRTPRLRPPIPFACLPTHRLNHEDNECSDPDPADAGLDPESQAILSQSKRKLRAAIASLPPRLRHLVIRRYFHDEELEVLARTAGISVTTASLRLAAARVALHLRLSDRTPSHSLTRHRRSGNA